MRGGTRRPSPPRQVRAEGVIHAVDPCVIPPSARPAKPAISPEVSTDSSAAPSPCAGMGPAVAASGDRPNRAPRASACEPYRELIVEAVGRGRNAMAIWQDRVDAHGFAAPYPSVRRFVSKLRQRPAAQARVVITTAPGRQAQVDYGDGPMVRDPASSKYRRTRHFVLMTILQRAAGRRSHVQRRPRRGAVPPRRFVR